MVKAPFRAVAFALSLAVLPAIAAQAVHFDYNIGEKAGEDIVTPVPLVVVDVEATEARKQREAERVHVIYRFFPNTGAEVVAAFRSTFSQTRVNFLDAVEERFKKRKLTLEEVESEEFGRFASSFQRRNVLFPAGSELAATWALGESGEDVEALLVSRLKETMKEYIRDDFSPEDIRVGSTLCLVSLGQNETLTEFVVRERGINIPKTRFISLPRSKSELANSFGEEQRAVGRYLASFIKPNCLMEADMTRELRAKRTEGVVVTEQYRAGQVVARRGQVIDAKIKSALDQIREKLAASRVPEVGVAEQPAPAVENAVAAVTAKAVEPKQETLGTLLAWIFGGFAALALLLLTIVWKLSRRPQVTLLPVPLSSNPMTSSAGLHTSPEDLWKERALVAEQRVEKIQAAARSGLLRQLGRWLSEKMTQKLVAQRAELLDAHQKAALEMADLEARLVKVQAPLQERLEAYERRIVELEKELALKGEENRELIKAKIQLARKHLELERAKNRVEYN